ncbi:hypothetical protein JW964_13400 [candidate division KSB1 bacterium]|nr:hypothetical protein [candidate division KSB1 bacterium]
MFTKRHFFLLTLVLLSGCSQDQEDIKAFKDYLTSADHENHLRNLVLSIDFLKFGYDNIVSKEELDTLQLLSKQYQNFLTGYKPQFKSTQKLQKELMDPVSEYTTSLTKLRDRIDLYQELTQLQDSVGVEKNFEKADSLEQQAQIIRESITNKFLIQLTIVLIDDLTARIHTINQKRS